MQEDAEQSGQVLDGRYRVLSRLGEGGMGTVYLAEHVGLGQRVAIKFLHTELMRHPGAVKRFLQEARVISQLNHDHVIRVFDMNQTGDAAYYAMELLDGEDLRTMLDRTGVLPWSRVRRIAYQLCSALAAAHAKGVIHRDLKPENCFLVRRADGLDQVKLLDFGIAKVQGGAHLTVTGETLGTVAYMAPEQTEGRADARSDVYSLGVMMYEMLSGRLPHEGSAIEVIARLARGTPATPLHEIHPSIPAEVSALVQRAIAPAPEQRFPAVAELMAAIVALAPARRAAAAAPAPAKPVAVAPAPRKTPAAAPRRTTRRSRQVVPALAVGVGIFVVFFGIAWKLLDLGGTAPGTGAPREIELAAQALPVEPTVVAPAVLEAPAVPVEPAAPVANAGSEAASVSPVPVPAAAPSAGASADLDGIVLEPSDPPATASPRAPAGGGLSRQALVSKLQSLLVGCTPGFVTETVKVRATPRDPGPARLELVHAGGLRRQDVECAREVLQRTGLKVAGTGAITVDVQLAAR